MTTILPLSVLQTIIAALRTSVDQTVKQALLDYDHKALAKWCNDATSTKAWTVSVSKRDMFEAMNISTYDAVSAGKKESWQLMLSMAPLDFSRGGMRKGVLDIFVAADANAMLASFTENASQLEVLIGGSSTTTGTVTALKRGFVGVVEVSDLKQVFPRPRV